MNNTKAQFRQDQELDQHKNEPEQKARILAEFRSCVESPNNIWLPLMGQSNHPDSQNIASSHHNPL